MLNLISNQGNENQNYSEMPFYTRSTGKNLKVWQLLERMRDIGTSYALLMGVKIGTTT